MIAGRLSRTDRLGLGARSALWLALLASWAIAVFYMWQAATTIPSAERLAESRLAVIPGPRTLLTAVIFSALELAVVLTALWPGQAAFYATRLAVSALALVTWFIMTTPIRTLSRMDWVHRRWLAFMAIVITGALLALLGYRLAGRLGDGARAAGRRGSGPPAAGDRHRYRHR